MTDPYDLAVIGGGPGGYVAAIRAAQLGMSVACIDKRATLGGTCLNVGCIPSKALLQSSEIYERTAGHLAEHGVAADNVRLDLAAMMARKDKVVGDLTKGIGFLFKKNKVDWLTGQARFAAADRLTVSLNEGGEREIAARKVLIATGSASMDLPGVTVDEDRIVSSTGALAFPEVPEHLVVVGAGVIGLELGSVWRRLGARVTVVEYLDRIVPTLDSEIAKMFQRLLARQGLSFRLGSKVTGASIAGDKVTLSVEVAAGGGGESLEADRVLVAIGRRPYTEGLGLDVIGAAVDERGFIKVDDHFRTTVENVHAIGDVIPGPMLAHKAEEDGVAAVEIMAGQAGHVDYDRVPNVIYTHPEVAAVGMTEDQAREKGLAVKIGKFPFSANSRARCNGDSDGVVKIIADAETDRILGAHIVGPDAGTLIAELVGVMEFGASAEDVARTCHAHPSLNEAVREAALAVAGRAIHV